MKDLVIEAIKSLAQSSKMEPEAVQQLIESIIDSKYSHLLARLEEHERLITSIDNKIQALLDSHSQVQSDKSSCSTPRSHNAPRSKPGAGPARPATAEESKIQKKAADELRQKKAEEMKSKKEEEKKRMEEAR